MAEFPKPKRNDGGTPCGECHLSPGERCDICGAVAPGAPKAPWTLARIIEQNNDNMLRRALSGTPFEQLLR